MAKRPSRSAALAKAKALLQQITLIDGHNDVPWVVRLSGKGNVAKYRFDKKHLETDVDIPRMRAGMINAQVHAAYLPTGIANPATVTLEQIDIIHQIEQQHADVFLPVRQVADIARARRAGKIASITSVEGGVGLEGSLSPLRMWHALGMRVMTLCHNETLPWIDSATDARRHDGLTVFGRQVVRELNRLGVLVDLSHGSPKSALDAIEASRAPIALTHSNAFALSSHPRNAPDEVLRAIKKSNGIVMATFVPAFIRQKTWDRLKDYCDEYGKARTDLAKVSYDEIKRASLSEWETEAPALLCDHIEYMTNIVGIDCIGIGSDFYGGANPPGLEDASKFPNLFAELIMRGWGDAALAKIAGKNFIRIMTDVEKIGKRLRGKEPVPVQLSSIAAH
ncbi:MAG: dipeptidase [Beijerinckiaceae bacterium]